MWKKEVRTTAEACTHVEPGTRQLQHFRTQHPRIVLPVAVLQTSRDRKSFTSCVPTLAMPLQMQIISAQGGIINITAVSCACLDTLNNVLDPLKKMVALPLSSLKGRNLKTGFHPVCISLFCRAAFYHPPCLPLEQSICYHSFVMV